MNSQRWETQLKSLPDDATVVVGTVIDPELNDEIRVTVVANRSGSGEQKPTKVIDNTLNSNGMPDYDELETAFYEK